MFTVPARAADALSKSNYDLFRQLVPDSEEMPRVIPEAIKSWLADPKPDPDLGGGLYWSSSIGVWMF